MSVGYKKDLEVDDLYCCLDEDKSEDLGLKLQKYNNILQFVNFPSNRNSLFHYYYYYRSWDEELAKCKKAKEDGTSVRKPSLLRALVRTFGLKFMLVGLLALFEECFLRYLLFLIHLFHRLIIALDLKLLFRIAQPLCLGQLVKYFIDSDESPMPTSHAYLYATGVVLGSALFTFSHHPYFFACQHTGMQIRVAACSLVYKKVNISNITIF